jgi:hypothetical protein
MKETCAMTDLTDPTPLDPSEISEAPAPHPPAAGPMTASLSALSNVTAETVSATGSAIAAANTKTLSATASAVGMAQVEGDASVRFSTVPLLIAKGDAEFRQAYASAFLAAEHMSVSQGGAPLIVGRRLSVDTGGGVLLVAEKASVRRGWIGMLLAKDADISEDSRVLFTTRTALIIAVALLGGFGLVALGLYFGARRLSEWRPGLRVWNR